MKLKLMNYLVWFMLFLSLVMLIFPLFLSGNYQQCIFETKIKPFMGWKTVTNQGNIQEIEVFPARLKAQPGEPVRIYNCLPERISPGAILFLRTDYQSVHIQIDGKTVYSFGETETIPFMGSKLGNLSMIHLKADMQGKPITIEISSDYETYAGSLKAVYLASHYEAAMILLLLGLRNMILTVFFFLAAVYFFLNSLCLEKKGLLTPYRSISLFCICSAAWVFAESQGLFLLIPNPLFVYLTANISYMISPVFFLIFLRWKEPEYEKTIHVMISAVSINVIISIISQLSTKTDLWMTMDTTKLFMLGGGILFLYSNIRKKRYRKRDFLEIAILGVSVLMIVGMAADIYNFYMHQYQYYGVTTTAAIFGFLICMGIDMINRTKTMSESAHGLEEELKKAEISMLSNQIQPHFIYNCLATISYLCKTDAGKADEATLHLSGYLRHNVNYANEQELISFMQEVRYVNDYMYLEQIRFPKIRFLQHLEVTELQIPPLTIQPFVENAVKHGLSQKPEGGRVSLRSWLEQSEIVILITDDGVGFDQHEIMLSCSKGLKNASKRLELITGAVIRIKSQKGKGTEVEIRIKKNKFQEVSNV